MQKNDFFFFFSCCCVPAGSFEKLFQKDWLTYFYITIKYLYTYSLLYVTCLGKVVFKTSTIFNFN